MKIQSLAKVCLLAICLSCMQPATSSEKNESIRDSPEAATEEWVQAKWYDDLEEALQNPDSVYYLSVRERNYKVFPPEIIKFKNLRELDISMNLFEYLPDNIEDLQNLESLTSAYGPLKSLPDSIGKLKKLRYLNLLDNDLVILPGSIGDLESLEELNLNGNPIRALPPEIFNLKRLKWLWLRTNDQKSLISEADQQKIRAGLPECRIIFE